MAISPRQRAWELDQYDTLGPLAKAVIDSAPKNVSIAVMLAEFHKRRCEALHHLDPEFWPAFKPLNDPDVDRSLAEMIRARITSAWPGFEPLVDKRGGHGGRS